MDRITLRDVRAAGRHGANPGERARTQPFVLDAIVEFDASAAQVTDDLRDTLDYALLRDRLVGIVQTTSYQLLERLAGDLLAAIFEDPRVARAEITVAKPGILSGATPAVTLVRANPRHEPATAHRAYVGLGANLADPAATLRRAVEALGELGNVARVSSFYRTQPWGKTDQPDFVNAVALLQTRLAPRALLAAFQSLEVRAGRRRDERWGPRVLDLDLLRYDDLEADEPGLRVPHPRMLERAFVLVPLAEIDAAFIPLRDALDPSELGGVVRLE